MLQGCDQRLWAAARLIACSIAAATLSPDVPFAATAPCNPVIDGTYCAEQPIRPREPRPNAPYHTVAPIQTIGNAISPNQDQPGTLAGITFGKTQSACMGLLRRGNCR